LGFLFLPLTLALASMMAKGLPSLCSQPWAHQTASMPVPNEGSVSLNSFWWSFGLPPRESLPATSALGLAPAHWPV